MIIKNWNQKIDILLVLKNKCDVLGYSGRGDFSIMDKRLKISRIFRNQVDNNYMFTGLQIISPNVIKKKKTKKFSLRDIFLNQFQNKEFMVILMKMTGITLVMLMT